MLSLFVVTITVELQLQDIEHELQLHYKNHQQHLLEEFDG